MLLRRLEADRLRNLDAVDLGLESGLTVVVGGNGQGKTSLLESIYLLATGRSFRTRKIEELVAWGGGPLRVAGRIEARAGSSSLAAMVDGPVRRLLVDEEEKGLEFYLGRLHLVDLTQGRMQALRGDPEERRRFLDRGIVGLQPGYLRALGEYRRVLVQRNALLRGAGPSPAGEVLRELDAWDERLTAAAGRIHRRRREYIVRLASRLAEVGRVPFPDGERLRIRYEPSPREARDREAADFEALFRDALERRRPRDLGLGFTSVGPHRDGLVVELGQADLRKFGSAGQVRTAMVALKLAKLGLLRENRGEAPLFLMDDFDADLDEARAAAVASTLHREGFQAVIATSKEGLVERIDAPYSKVRMQEGVAQA